MASKGGQARSLQRNTLWKELFEQRAEELAEEWRSCEDIQRREALWAEQRALTTLAEHFDDTIATLAEKP